jgi:hypothetical protein
MAVTLAAGFNRCAHDRHNAAKRLTGSQFWMLARPFG